MITGLGKRMPTTPLGDFKLPKNLKKTSLAVPSTQNLALTNTAPEIIEFYKNVDSMINGNST